MVMIDGHGNLYGLWIQICMAFHFDARSYGSNPHCRRTVAALSPLV